MSLAAKLWLDHRGLPKGEQIERVVLKVDIMIVATAKAAGAKTFFSHEPKVRRLVESAGMQARDLPTHSEDLFIDAKSRRGTNLE